MMIKADHDRLQNAISGTLETHCTISWYHYS